MPPQTWDATEAARMALSAIYRTGQRFGAVHLIDVLRGKEGERMRRWDHDKLGVFGVGTGIGEAAWRGVFRQLVALGYARVDHESHGALRLTESSRAVLKGGQKVEMREVVERGRSDSKTLRRSSALAALRPEAVDLFERLKAWRREEARTQAVPAYVILHDSTLAAIAERQPRNLDALADVGGMGAKKLERYGAALIELMQTA